MNSQVGQLYSLLEKICGKGVIKRETWQDLKDKLIKDLNQELVEAENSLGYSSHKFTLLSLPRDTGHKELINMVNRYINALQRLKEECSRIVDNLVDLSQAESLTIKNTKVDLSTVEQVESWISYLKEFKTTKASRSTLKHPLEIFFFNVPDSETESYADEFASRHVDLSRDERVFLESEFIGLLKRKHYIATRSIELAVSRREARIMAENKRATQKTFFLTLLFKAILPCLVSLLAFGSLTILILLNPFTPPRAWYFWLLYVLGFIVACAGVSWGFLKLSSILADIYLGRTAYSADKNIKPFYVPLVTSLFLVAVFLITLYSANVIPLLLLILDSIAFAIGFVVGVIKHSLEDSTFEGPFSPIILPTVLSILTALFVQDTTLCITLFIIGVIIMVAALLCGQYIVDDIEYIDQEDRIIAYLPVALVTVLFVGFVMSFAVNPVEHPTDWYWWFLYIPAALILSGLASWGLNAIAYETDGGEGYYIPQGIFLAVSVSTLVVGFFLGFIPLLLMILGLIAISIASLIGLVKHLDGTDFCFSTSLSSVMFPTFLTIFASMFAATTGLCITLFSISAVASLVIMGVGEEVT